MPRLPGALNVGSVLGVPLAAFLAITGWHVIGPDHLVYAIVLQGAFTFMGLLAGPTFADVARSRYTVADVEPRLYALVGAEALRRLLEGIGWNRAIESLREQNDPPTRLERLVRGTELSETGHALGGAATLLVAATAAAAQHPTGALQIAAVGLVAHGYPIMIQRMVRHRALRHRR